LRVDILKYWLEALIAAYIFSSLDAIITAYGILNHWGIEGNFLIRSIIPETQPILQIIYITCSFIFAYWFVFFAERFMIKFDSMKVFYYNFVGWASFAACLTHTYGITTWIMIKP
jgi:hypothetical protein